MANLDFNSILGTVAQAQEPIIVPVPVQVPAKTKKSTEVSTKTKTPVQNNAPWPAPPVVNFGPSPTVPQDVVPGMPQQPVWQQDLSGFLNGMPLAQAIAPPTYQGFGMPVFSDAQAFAMSPEGYNHVLDTTKNNIAFNNKVAGDNYNNTLNIIKTLQAADSANQEQYSRSIQNRNAVLSGNKMQQDIAQDQSPQQKATIQNQLSTLSDQRHEDIANRGALRDHKYALERQAIHDSRVEKNDKKKSTTELQNLLIKRDIDIWGDAVKGFTPEELDIVSKAGSSNMLDQLMAQNPNIRPLSKFNLRAAYEAQQRLKSYGGNVGNIFSPEATASPKGKAMSIDEGLKFYREKKK